MVLHGFTLIDTVHGITYITLHSQFLVCILSHKVMYEKILFLRSPSECLK